MKRGIGIVALLGLLVALGGGGWYLYRDWFGVPLTSRDDSGMRAGSAAAEDLPIPELVGEAATPDEGSIATLTRVQRSVRRKRTDGLSWERAKQRMPLYTNDAVRTFERSSATIAFSVNDRIEVDENSLIIIMPLEPEASDDEIVLAFLSPELLDSLAEASSEERDRSIREAAAQRRLRISPVSGSGGREGKTRLKVRTMPDNSTSIVSLEGDLKIVGPGGREIILKEEMVTKVTSRGKLIEPRLLPAAPALMQPQHGAKYAFLRKAPKVKFSWESVERAGSYRVVVARDRKFRRIFADEKVRGTSFSIKNVQPSTYYWRVRSRDKDGFEGAYSKVRSFVALQDESPPQLTILSPPEMFVSPGPTVELSGKTDRGARVRVNGEPVQVAADGTFRTVVSLKEGINLVNIETSDTSGNTEYGKRLITYKGAKRSNAAAIGGN